MEQSNPSTSSGNKTPDNPGIPPQYDPKSVEARIYKEWTDREFFMPKGSPSTRATPKASARRASSGNKSTTPYTLHPTPSYTILLPPPNITGNLHMGHALNATISDILIRYHRMKGYNTAWLPGIDHAGIAAQNVVEKNLRKENKSRFDLGREEFVKKVWEWKEKYGNIILDQLKRIGASCDWSRTRFTMDPAYSEDVLKAFVHYYEKGFIYRGKRLVNWCPRCQTSLSDLEIEYKEEAAKLYFIKYPIFPERGQKAESKDNNNVTLRQAMPTGRQAQRISYITVATTRPETMLGDAAVAVNPKDSRYKKLIGESVNLPLTDRKIPIIGDDAIDMKFGTGMVKVTPAHDATDAEIGERHKLAVYEIIDERGRMKNVPAAYTGLKTREAREKVAADLAALGLMEKIEDYKHNASTCDRCGTVLEPLLSNQWFIKMKELAEKTASTVKSKKTRITPKNFEKGFFAWLKNIHDWCISRQIWWGHRLPVWFHEPKCVPKMGHEDDIVKCKEMLVSLTEPKCEFCDAKFLQSEDVLDTWFSSALWPFAGISPEDQKQFYPSNVLITARDIINLWVGRMIFSGLEFIGKTPFADTLIHATILTKDGKRMSKSLGTGIDPLQYIDQYGADATRFGIIWQTMGNQDIRWDEAAVMAGKKFANKIWNASRFVLGRVGNASTGSANNYSLSEAKSDLAQSKGYSKKSKLETDADKKILKKLSSTKKSLEKHIAAYEFGQALHGLYDFFWHDFCDVYLEASKNQSDENTNALLLHILTESLKMLHPFMPHLTEEIYQKLPASEGRWLIVEKW